MNNIYLTNTGNFAYAKTKELINNIADDLVQGWVDEYGLTNNLEQTKDFTTTIKELGSNRYRVHLFHSKRGWNAALRLLSSKILSFEELSIDSKDILSIANKTGLTLFCGATGSGKSTTMNTTIDSLLVTNELGVAISIEDPIEYLHHKDTIFQREVETDVKSFKDGLIQAVRANPATIIIGEIRDSATALEAVKAGLSGHRVFATLHAGSIKEAISRLWGYLDDQGDELLVQSLQGIVAQHLIHITNDKKHLIYEALHINNQVKNLLQQIVKDNQTNLEQISQMQYSQKRLSLEDKKQELINSGIDESLLNF